MSTIIQGMKTGMAKVGTALKTCIKSISNAYYTLMEMIIVGVSKLFKILLTLIKPLQKVAKKIGKNSLKFLDKITNFPPITMLKRLIKKRIEKRTMAQKKALTGYLYLSPWILGFLGLVIYPFIRIVYMSFHNVFQYQQHYEFEWVGLDNFSRILTKDIDFVLEVQNFVVRVLLYTPVIIALSIIIAILLNQNIKGKSLFRMVFFLPIIILNGQLLENMSNYGGTDIHLGFFIIDVISTIVPSFAVNIFIDMFGYIIEILWYTGVPILIFLAMLQKIDRSLYEAASIDGANAWSIFWKITLPIIRPAITVSIIFIVVFLANFDGNPINQIILVSRSEGSRREGYASALALIYSFVQIVVITILYLIAREKPQKGRV